MQKWFIEHLEHPYAKKLEKKALAQETKLSLKQITGWFTNNRKRKYNRVLALAKKRGRNLDYVRDVMIMKFDKDLDPPTIQLTSTRAYQAAVIRCKKPSFAQEELKCGLTTQ